MRFGGKCQRKTGPNNRRTGGKWGCLVQLDIVTYMDMEAVIRQLQDTMVVLAHVSERNAAGLKDHAEWLAGQQMRLKEHELWQEKHNRSMEEHDRKMAEFDDKLNGLIAIVDGMIRGKQQ